MYGLSLRYWGEPGAELNQVLGTPEGFIAVDTHCSTIASACAKAWLPVTLPALVLLAVLLAVLLIAVSLVLVLLVLVLVLVLVLLSVAVVAVRVLPSYISRAAAGIALPTNPIWLLVSFTVPSSRVAKGISGTELYATP
jgi:hypothetical protein